MAITLEHREKATMIRIDGPADIAVAADLKRALLDAFTGSNAVEVSLDSCTEIDVTAVQLLWAAEREARSLNIRFTLEGDLPNSIGTALNDAGFEKFPVPV